MCYRCAAYGDEERWQPFLRRLNELIEHGWDCSPETASGVRDKMTIKFVEDDSLQGKGVDEVRR